MKKRTEKTLTFKAEQECVRKLQFLSKVLKIDRSKAIRLAIDDAFDKYVSPGSNREFYVLDKDALPQAISHMRELSERLGEYVSTTSLFEVDLEWIEATDKYKDLLPEIRRCLKASGGKMTLGELNALRKAYAHGKKTADGGGSGEVKR